MTLLLHCLGRNIIIMKLYDIWKLCAPSGWCLCWCFLMLYSAGIVTAEIFQSKEDSDVMSKMVEDLDEVGFDFWGILCLLSFVMYNISVTALWITNYRAQVCSIKDFWHFHGYWLSHGPWTLWVQTLLWIL